MLSDEELEKAMRWTIRGLKEAQVDPNSIQAVATWMLENQLPAKEVWLAETDALDEEERLAQIEAHEAAITQLKGGTINV
jgi:hypothetical protein